LRAVPALLLMLTFGSGMIDAISYIALGKVFLANMTGNVLFLGMAVAGVREFSIGGHLVALIGYALGAYACGLVIDRSVANKHVILRNAVAGQAVLLAVCLILGVTFGLGDQSVSADVIRGIAAAAMGMQNAAARKVAIPDMTTSVVTTTLTALAADHAHGGQGAAPRRFLVICLIFSGAIVGATIVLKVNANAAIGVLIGWLAVVVLVAFRQSRDHRPAAM
jgi:uncharacterized membrane protein YoaK (UPF0700 family)